MGLFGSDSFLGGLLGGTNASTMGSIPQASVGGQAQDVFLSNYFFPQILQYLQTSAATGQQGGAGFEMLQKLSNAEGYTPTMADWFKVSQQMTQEMPGLQAQAAEKNAKNFQQTYDTMSKIPALSDIFSKASGNVDSTGALAKIFGDLSGSALGSAASSGFLTDAVKQGNVLGPLALQKYQMEQSIQQNAQQQALGFAGAGGLAGSGLFGSSLGGSSQFVPGVMNAAGMFGGANLQAAYSGSAFNNSAQNQFAQFNSGILGFNSGAGGDAEGQTAGLLSLAFAACWVADELYGIGSEKAMLARLWATTHDTPFLRLYKRHGRAWAAWLKANPWAKPLAAPIWDRMVRAGEAMLARGEVA